MVGCWRKGGLGAGKEGEKAGRVTGGGVVLGGRLGKERPAAAAVEAATMLVEAVVPVLVALALLLLLLSLPIAASCKVEVTAAEKPRTGRAVCRPAAGAACCAC